MKPEIVKAIFTNLLFVIGVVFIIFGFIRGTLTITQLIIFPKYPLESYEETRCAMEFNNFTVALEVKAPVETEAEKLERKLECEIQVERARLVKKTSDIVTSITTLISGFVLVLVFKKFILYKESK